MNKKFLKHYMETNPEGTAQTYIFLMDNQDIALNIVMSGYQALCLVQEDDGYYFSADSFIEEMRSIQFTGSCQSAYHYVASCSVKWVNDKLLTFFKDAGLDGKAGWQLFKEKEYLGKLDNQKEVEKLLEQYILRFEREPKEQPELSRFHLFDAKGNVKGVRDMEIVDYLVENVQFFVVGITPYYYEHGTYWEDHNGVRMKYRIQKLIYRDQIQSGVIKRIYNLLITQPKVHREAYELNKQPVRWINFKNGYYDPVTGEMLEHNSDYLTINQIPFPYYPEDCEQVLQGGENIKKYLASSLPNKEEQQTLRNRNGLMSRSEQEHLEEEIKDVRDRNSKLQTQVNQSSVKAVEQAQQKQEEAEKQARQAEYQAEREKKRADMEIQKVRRKAKSEMEDMKEIQFFWAWGYLCVIFFSLIQNGAFQRDLMQLIMLPVNWCRKYAIWFEQLDYMGYSTGEVVFERIFSSAVIMAGIVGGVFLVWGGIERYRKIWDDIYKMVLIASFSFIAVLGNLIREYLPFNLLFVIFVINVGAVLIRIYLNNKNVGY